MRWADLNGLEAEDRKETLLKHIRQLREGAGIRTNSGELGVAPKDIAQLSINAFNDPCLVTNPRQANIHDIETLYEKALSNR